jgi:RHS repeat-associated protein
MRLRGGSPNIFIDIGRAFCVLRVKNLAILAQIDTQKLQMSDTLRIFEEHVGAKNYELSNHLGNVLATISDKTIFNTDHYNGIVYSAQLYYPFGWEIPTLSYTAKKYRFGFNGVEKAREIGEGVNTTFYREQDTRAGRWWSFDPRPNAAVSPYAMMENNPIAFSDVLGDTVIMPNRQDMQRLSDDLNRIYKRKYNAEPFQVIQRLTAFGEIFKGKIYEDDPMFQNWINDYVLGANPEFPWGRDEYTSAMFDVISVNSEINVRFDPYMTINDRGGGFTDDANNIRLSAGLADYSEKSNSISTNRMDAVFYSLGMVFMHEALYHVHPLGSKEEPQELKEGTKEYKGPNIMRHRYSAMRGNFHEAGENQNLMLSHAPEVERLNRLRDKTGKPVQPAENKKNNKSSQNK